MKLRVTAAFPEGLYFVIVINNNNIVFKRYLFNKLGSFISFIYIFLLKL